MLFTCHKSLVSCNSSCPASVCGCSVNLTRIFCQTWKIQRCTRAVGQHRAIASSMPFWPSQTTTLGHGNCSSSFVHVMLDSQPTHIQPMTWSGVRAMRQTRLPTPIHRAAQLDTLHPSARVWSNAQHQQFVFAGTSVMPSGRLSSFWIAYPVTSPQPFE